MGNTASMSSTPQLFRVRTLNVLAEVFFTLSDYSPYVADPSVLPYSARNRVLMSYLSDVSSEVDIFCLQEVEDYRVPELQAALGPNFHSVFVPHDAKHWGRYYDAAHPYVPNGNMIFIRKSLCSTPPTFDAIVCSTGAHFPTATFIAPNGYRIQVVCVHLDSDVGGNRKKEMDEVLAAYAGNTHPLIICGDFNASTDISNLQKTVRDAGLTDVMLSLGPTYDVPTHPFTDMYNKNKIYSRIDRCAVSSQFTILPSSQVLSVSGLSEQRIMRDFETYGTDHYPVKFDIQL